VSELPAKLAGPRWLQELVAHLREHGVPVKSAAASGGVLTLTLGSASERGLRVDVKARTPGQGCFLETKRLAISYRGAGRLAPDHGALLSRLGDVLRGVEADLPAVLDAPVGVDAPGADGVAGFPYSTVEWSRGAVDDTVWCELLVRLTSRCNQECPFCSAPPPHAEPSRAAVVTWLDEVLPRLPPRPLVTLTGGEPTIWTELRELVVELLTRDCTVRVQTNAVTFADPHVLDAWPVTDRLSFFVSFHAATPALYDLCTGSSGQLERAVAGIRNLAARGFPLVLNLVATRHNVGHILDWVRAIPTIVPPPAKPRIHFSIAMCPDHRPTAPDCLVRYTDLSPRLQEAAQLAASLGVECESLLSSSHASIPACLVDDSFRVRGGFGQGRGGSVPVQRGHEAGIEDTRKPWVKARRCEQCSQSPYCLGLPRAYVLKFGLDELKPIR
jgi:pyruvate-formate lyase-activating enzyme